MNEDNEFTSVSDEASPTQQPPSTKKDTDVKWRAKFKLEKELREDLQVKSEHEKNELLMKIDSLADKGKSFENKYIEAEVKASAVAAGLRDMDLIKLIDTSSLTINEDGSIQNLNSVIEDFKAKKPDYFGPEKKMNSSSNAAFPKEDQVLPRSAYDLNAQEWSLAKRGILPRI